ncbi:hypothetical protein K439DRAFT_1663628 [Ramaria rubella]|nr:hypothetical protein K439DRAFT_1663628 [Ramaria rubella]
MSLSPANISHFLGTEGAIIYNTLAASAFFFWDYCITFGQEVELVWRWRWSPISFLFVAIRYLTFAIRIVELLFYANIAGVLRPSMQACVVWVRFEILTGHLLALGVDLLLMTRTYAYFGRDKRVLIGLIVMLAVGQAGGIVLLVSILPGFVLLQTPLPTNIHSASCIVLGASPIFSFYLIPSLSIETIMFIMVLARFIYTRFNTKTQARSHMLYVFIRDGAWAFTLVFGTFLWTALSYRLNPEDGDIAVTWLFSVLGFCGSRLVLNLRAEAQESEQVQEIPGFELMLRNKESDSSPSHHSHYPPGFEFMAYKPTQTLISDVGQAI